MLPGGVVEIQVAIMPQFPVGGSPLGSYNELTGRGGRPSISCTFP